MKHTENYGASNLNDRPYYVTGLTTMNNGDTIAFDEFKSERVTLNVPVTYDYGNIVYLTCEETTETCPAYGELEGDYED